MADISPAAQAVLDAFINAPCCNKRSVAATLRGAADQAIPMTKSPWGSTLVPVLTAQESRERILAIADELDPPEPHLAAPLSRL
jgi:hypothetical protein